MTVVTSSKITAGLGTRIVFAVLISVVLLAAIASRIPKRLIDFDQSFYLTIAYDIDRHGVFSNGIFDDVDSTQAKPPPGMFFGPLYPLLVLAVMKVDPRFEKAVECSVESNHKRREGGSCEIYATPIYVLHALLLALGILAIGRTAEAIFTAAPVFFLSGAIATAGVAAEAELLSYIMTESLTFALYALLALPMVLGLKTSRWRYWAAAGFLLGLLCLARPSFVLLAPVMLLLILLGRWVSTSDRQVHPWGGLLAFTVAFVVVIGPWMARNSVSVGKLGLTEEYGAAVLIERFAFNTMTPREFVLAFPYCVPAIGPIAVRGLLSANAMDRFEWNRPGSFFATGRAHRVALGDAHGRLDPVFGDLLRAEMQRNGWRHIAVTVPLAWCGLWVSGVWSLLFLPLFGVACIEAVRRAKPLFLLYALLPLAMVVAHAALANHYSRYNLILIGPISAGAAWLIVLAATALRSWRQNQSKQIV